MEKLIKELKRRIGSENLEKLESVYPFNEVEDLMIHLIGTGKITLEEYLKLRKSYLKRNPYLKLFEITAPRTFGETWAQNYLNEIVPELRKPSKKYDSDYSKGKYDFWYDGIRIEVKASRAVRREGGGTLIEKALSSNSKDGFDMNFQQIKPDCCDVFVWIGVWTDVIRYWVLSSDEVKNNRKYSKGQHRNSTGEGQLWLTEKNIDKFEQYEVEEDEILAAIIEKGQ